jgi:hypothetical protein
MVMASIVGRWLPKVAEKGGIATCSQPWNAKGIKRAKAVSNAPYNNSFMLIRISFTPCAIQLYIHLYNILV